MPSPAQFFHLVHLMNIQKEEKRNVLHYVGAKSGSLTAQVINTVAKGILTGCDNPVAVVPFAGALKGKQTRLEEGEIIGLLLRVDWHSLLVAEVAAAGFPSGCVGVSIAHAVLGLIVVRAPLAAIETSFGQYVILCDSCP
jgi:hypothetical protein